MSNIEILKINNTNLQTIFNTINDLLPNCSNENIEQVTPKITTNSSELITTTPSESEE